MGSRYPELPGVWGRKLVVLGDGLMQQSDGAGRGILGTGAIPVSPCPCCPGGLEAPCHQLRRVQKRQLPPAPSLQVHGQKAAWEDPVEWVRDTLPWPSAQQDQSKLYHLPPPTVGPHSTVSPPEERTVKDTTPSSLDADPLVRPCSTGRRGVGRAVVVAGGEPGGAALRFPSCFSV